MHALVGPYVGFEVQWLLGQHRRNYDRNTCGGAFDDEARQVIGKSCDIRVEEHGKADIEFDWLFLELFVVQAGPFSFRSAMQSIVEFVSRLFNM